MSFCAKSACALLLIGLCFSCFAFAGSLPGAPNCPMFPANNVWNADISALPVHPNSANYISSMGLTAGVHPDFGSDLKNGIPYNVVSGTQTKLPVTFGSQGGPESDSGPYPIPPSPNIEGNVLSSCPGSSDCHILIVDKDACILYELDAAGSPSPGTWIAYSGAIWSLNSNALRTDSWTSADAAGLPILPGLVRFDEVNAGLINHALRFTASITQKAHIYPARHDASSNTDPNQPPMGLRVRLKAGTNLTGLGPQALVVAHALQKYGMILADNGQTWFVSGASDTNFNDTDLHTLQTHLHGSDFEVVDTSSLFNGSDSNTRTVNVGQGGTNFVDTVSGNSTTTIPVNTTVVWNWVASNHSTTSGSCSGSCTPDGLWDSGVNNSGNVFMRVFNQVGTYHYFCSVHNSFMQGTVIVTPPSDYTLAIANSPRTAFAGQNATFNGTLTTSNGYTNTVNLSCGTGHPATCNPSPNPQTPTSGGAAFTVTAGDTTAKDYTFNVQGVGTDPGQASHSQSVTLHVVDFSLTAPAPGTVSAVSGTNPATTQTASFQVSATGALPATVSLSCPSGLPAGATCNFTPSTPLTFSAAGSQPVTVSITITGGTTAGNYPVTISAAATGAVTKLQNLTLQVIDFSLAAPAPAAVATAVSGGTTITPTANLQVSANGAIPNSVTLSCMSGLPAGASCNFIPSTPLTFNAAGSQPVTVSVTVPGGTAAGAYTVTVSAASTGSVTKTQSLTLEVVDFAQGVPSPTSVSMTQSSVSQPVTFQLSPVNSSGFNAQVALSCSGVTGASCSWSPSSPVLVPGAPASVTLVVTTNGAAVGNGQTLTIQSSATVNGVALTHSQTLTLDIAAGVSTDLSIKSLTAQPDPAETKGPVSINVTAHNTGSDATGVNVNLLFSQTVKVISGTLPAGCTVNSGAVTCTIPDPFSAGADAPFTIQLGPPFGRNLTITATVGSSSVTDSNMSNNTMPVIAHIRPKPLARRGLKPKMP
jgi:plastocyanin